MAEKSIVEKVLEKKFSYRSKAVASVAVCILGGFCMYLTKGETGVGWSIVGLMLIWG